LILQVGILVPIQHCSQLAEHTGLRALAGLPGHGWFYAVRHEQIQRPLGCVSLFVGVGLALQPQFLNVIANQIQQPEVTQQVFMIKEHLFSVPNSGTLTANDPNADGTRKIVGALLIMLMTLRSAKPYCPANCFCFPESFERMSLDRSFASFI
jgi:hypothetical protein